MLDQHELHAPILAVVDLDGVVYDFAGEMTKWIALQGHRSLEEMPPPTSWDWYTLWEPPMGAEEFHGHMADAAENGHLWGCGSPLGGVDTMTAWRAILDPIRTGDPNFFVQVVSHRYITQDLHEMVFALTSAWLNTWGFHYDRLVLTPKRESKVDAVEHMRKQLGVKPKDVWTIDDNISNAYEYEGAGYTSTLGLEPHNEQLYAEILENSEKSLYDPLYGRFTFIDWVIHLHRYVRTGIRFAG